MQLSGQLIDTWWFGLTQRVSRTEFAALARLRAGQGFTAVQLVAGIPPEVGPENENARSEAGFPWTIDGAFNAGYLQLARERISLLNEVGLGVIVYGAWGHQIAWLGPAGMTAWWQRVVEALDDLDVVYCLTGESHLWIGEEDRVLPDRTSASLKPQRLVKTLPPRLQPLAHKLNMYWQRRLGPYTQREAYARRRQAWSAVLAALAQMTDRPILLHPNAGELATTAVDNPDLLAANTTQTGHSYAARSDLWRVPLDATRSQPERLFINLEPWYEGILNSFGPEDQLFAYWTTMLAGAASYCYGAHGVWHAGDGRFLAHWGKQTLAQAAALDTPRLLGLSHQEWLARQPLTTSEVEVSGDRLISIARSGPGGKVIFFPDVAAVRTVAAGRVWLPSQGRYVAELPAHGQVVLVSN